MEATLFAIRAARAFKEKVLIIKMDGGYHGTHDCVEVGVSPDERASGLPKARLEVRGVPASVLGATVVIPFNDLDGLEMALEKNKDEVAAIILEPMLGAAGQILPKPGFLKGV